MAVIDHFVNDFVDEDEVLPDAFLVKNAAIVAEDLHHAVDHVQDSRRGHICLARGDEINAELLREEVVDTVNILKPKQTTETGEYVVRLIRQRVWRQGAKSS